MCGRYEGPVDETWAELHDIFENFIPPPETYAGRQLGPKDSYPVLTRERDGTYALADALWWLIPSFYKGTVKDWKATTFNAKIEEAFEKPSFRGPWKSKHCLIPVSSFWEWSGEHPENPKKKQRYCITRLDNQPMVLAGLWDRAQTADGEITSFTVLTRAAGPDMSPLHHREPVILGRDQWKPWMECQPMPELIAPAPAGALRPAVEQRDFA